MNMRKVVLKDLAAKTDNFSGAELQAICTEAGYCAIRENREHVTHADFLQAIEKIKVEDEEDEAAGLIG